MTLTIKGAPITKKNSQRILINHKTGKRFIAPSEAYENYAEDSGWQIKRLPKPIDYPVNVCCVYYMPTKRKVDLCNLLEATCDILVAFGILGDDNSAIVCSHDGSRVQYDPAAPRVEITIEGE